jgi:hypothetical protein
MDAKQYNAAIKLSTVAAIKAGVSLPEIIGTLELAKINTERMAFTQAMKQQNGNIQAVHGTLPEQNAERESPALKVSFIKNNLTNQTYRVYGYHS